MNRLRMSRQIALLILPIVLFSCGQKDTRLEYNFDIVPDRIWVGEDFWTVPIEDWRIRNGRLECISTNQQASASLLTNVFSNMKGNFSISFDMGLIQEGNNVGASGLSIGVIDETDNDIRAAIFFGTGLNGGVHSAGYTFLGHQVMELPEGFDYSAFHLSFDAFYNSGIHEITMTISDSSCNEIMQLSTNATLSRDGIIQLVNNFRTPDSSNDGPNFWFDSINIKGTIFDFVPENRFGPVLWTMHTLSREVLKMTAQMPPLGDTENSLVHLQVPNTNGKWETIASEKMDGDARTATFRIGGWDASKDTPYLVLFNYIDSFGAKQTAEYTGVIKKDPVDRPLRMGGLTCQFSSGFPYSPLVENLTALEPDILFFSGDQIYEPNGGYSIKRSPEDMAILNYLGKWYMFGWVFGDLMRNTPTICTPDDHDVYHGNLWGEGGVPFDDPDIINRTNNVYTGDRRGFAQTVRFVNMVNRTQCEHLPDPFDPEPIEQGMSVWYTSLNYGRISFAIVSDRVFKTAPERVAFWETRKDHLTEPLYDASVLDIPGLKMLGERQEAFLNNWILDWKDIDMKVLLSQTVFANPATHHGKYADYLYGDLDSGGWPKTARNKAISILRKAFAFHINGDQHLASLLQYGIDDFRDAGWSFCTPAISIIYSRWFRPDELSIPVLDRPSHGNPNTGKYKDSFENLNYVYAIGNPGNFSRLSNRYEFEHAKSAGFGMIYFDQLSRNITTESWRFLANVKNPQPGDQHHGWPKTINQLDNYGREKTEWLPVLEFQEERNAVVQVINEDTNETEYIVRNNDNTFQPWVFKAGSYTVRVGHPEDNLWREITSLVSTPHDKDTDTLKIRFLK